MSETWLALAADMGFEEAAVLEPSKLAPLASVREMCAADRCHAYGRNWTCPPAVGTLEECAARIAACQQGLLLQTVGTLASSFDAEGYTRTEKLHMERFARFSQLLRQTYPDALCLGAGGCRMCPQCAYPQQCRFPEKAFSSMEAYGLLVSQVCRDCGVPYYHGPETITYSACILY